MMKIFRQVLLHIFSLILYFPLIIVLFLYLALHPTKMDIFFIGIQAILGYMNKSKEAKE